MVPSVLSFLQRRFGWLAAAGCAAALACGGCASAPSARAEAARPARVTFVNLTPYRWRVAFEGAWTGEVDPRRTVTVALAPGTYRVRQQVLAGDEAAAAVRETRATFSPEENCRWPLATVSSAEP